VGYNVNLDNIGANMKETILDYTLAITIAACLLMGLLAYFDVLTK
jgi:hypothetical protein